MADPPVPATPRASVRGQVSRTELFVAYLKIGLMGFGGVAPWARRVIVEERGWLSEEDYAAVLGFGQVLPGANTVNAAVIIGDRFQGPAGSVIAVLAMLTAPMAILVVAATLYDRFQAQPDLQGALAGIAAAAAGLVIGTGAKMAVRLKPDALAIVLGVAAFVAVAAFKVPLAVTVLVLAPVGLALGLIAERR